MTDLQSLAKKYGGRRTWTYRQTNLGTIVHTAWNSKTRWGICGGLSAYWVAEHADGGSLGDKLGGGNLGNLNHPMLTECVRLHKKASSQSSTYAYLSKWLKERKIDQVKKNITDDVGNDYDGKRQILARATVRSYGGGTQGKKVEDLEKNPNIANDIVSKGLRHLRNHYGLLGFYGSALMEKNAGHCTAVWIGHDLKTGAGDAFFFDPNYGEFYFPKKDNFFGFFRTFYHSTYITKTMNFTKGFALTPYAKRVIDMD